MFTALIVILGLIFLIIVHELGHFLAAKACGIKVEEFGVGFPPRLFSRRYGETLYSLNWIPFGGFVRLFGEFPSELTDSENSEVKSEKPSPDSSRAFSNQPIWKRVIVMVSGVLMNILAAWVIFYAIHLIGVPITVSFFDVQPESPAAAAGLLPGDQVVNFTSTDEFINFINDNRGQEISLLINRGGSEMEIIVTPRLETEGEQGALGVSVIQSGVSSSGPISALWASAETVYSLIIFIFTAVGMIIYNAFAGITPDVLGPVGVVNLAATVGESGLIHVLYLIALISVNLAVFNILPFPALDGGRLIFLLIEKIIRRPIPIHIESYINAFGFLVLVLLMILVTIKDVRALF